MKRFTVLFILSTLLFSTKVMATEYDPDTFKYTGESVKIKDEIDFLQIDDILAEIETQKSLEVPDLGTILAEQNNVGEDASNAKLPENNEKPQEVTPGMQVPGNAYQNISDIRQKLAARAYEYLRGETEYGRIGYSMYEHSKLRKNSKGNWIGKFVSTSRSGSIRNTWWEPEGAPSDKFWLDCSSFVGKVYQDCGVKKPSGSTYTPAMSTSTWQTSGVKIGWNDLQPGDILNISGSHVGMYVGNGKVIECTGTGKYKTHSTYVDQVTGNYQQIKETPVEQWKNGGYTPIRPAGLPS